MIEKDEKLESIIKKLVNNNPRGHGYQTIRKNNSTYYLYTKGLSEEECKFLLKKLGGKQKDFRESALSYEDIVKAADAYASHYKKIFVDNLWKNLKYTIGSFSKMKIDEKKLKSDAKKKKQSMQKIDLIKVLNLTQEQKNILKTLAE